MKGALVDSSSRVETGPHGGTVADFARRKAQASPSRTAFIEADGRAVSFAAIFREAEELALGLRTLGLVEGDTISFQLPNWREAVAINLAASILGLRVNPITPIYRGAELRMILGDSGSVLIFIPEILRLIDHVAMLDELRADLACLRHIVAVRGSSQTERSYEGLRAAGARLRPDRVPAKVDHHAQKLLLYTSGTTGRAKGVIHSHYTMLAGTCSATDYWGLGAEDVMLMPSPVTHITGYAFGLELPFLTDTSVVLMDSWDARAAIELIERHAVTVSIGATPFLKELIDEAERAGRTLPTLRLFACGGASVAPELIFRTAQLTANCRAFRVYGATEIPLVTKGFIKADQSGLAADTDGRVVDYDIKVVDLAGNEVPRGRVGEICARGPAMLVGYTNSEDEEGSIDADGYFHSGDLGQFTQDEAIIVTGRLKDIIIRGGENLSPVEIENALERHTAILEAVVVAMPHPRLGEGVAAFIRGHDGSDLPSLTEISEFLGEIGIARQKYPERVEYVDDFPRTASGKVRKDQLRDALRKPLIISLDH